MTPDRIVDTRTDGGPISLGETTLVGLSDIPGYTIFLNITLVNTSGSGYLSVFDSDFSRPAPYSSINWQGAGKVVANFGLVSLGTDGFNVYCGGSSGARTNFIIDLVGFAVDTSGAAAERDKFRRHLNASKGVGIVRTPAGG